MCPRAIALVLGKTVFGEFLIDLRHKTIPCHLRNHTGGSNGKGKPIAFHEGFMLHAEPFHRQPVDQCNIRLLRQGFERQAHRSVRCAKDVDLIDLLRADHFHRPDDGGIARDLLIKEFAALLGELLGIVEKRATKGPRQDDRRGCNRSSQRPSARLVDTRNPNETTDCKVIFVGEIRHVLPIAVETLLEGQVGRTRRGPENLCGNHLPGGGDCRGHAGAGPISAHVVLMLCS